MKIQGLEYRYPSGGFTLGPLDLVGPDDRPWLVVGPSGSGKSTLLRILGGSASPTGGIVRGFDPRSRAAYLPQFPERALAGRNLAEDLCGGVRPGAETRARLRRALEEAGLSGIPLSRRSRELSGGERRRVALALMLLTQCEFWGLDEPEAALDAEGASRLIQVLARQKAQGKTLWIATHRSALYRELRPWMVVLESGQLIDVGEVEEVEAHPEVQRVLRVPDRLSNRLWTEVQNRVHGPSLTPEAGRRLDALRSELLENPGLV